MAAEVLAAKLDLPMYRINLAQVVNKYIGETEKNLERVFDSVDACESVLFFDEADSLFGRRTEVRDSHDRYANLEISYLLQRMERFKGLVILATNRRRDLDDAFVRRLRYIVEFPFPDVAQRRLLWHSILPREQVDTSSLDIDFLARQFHLSGGDIRSAVFNACLQSATGLPRLEKPTLHMDQVVIAVKREYDKMQRTISLDQLGPYAKLIEGLEHE
jgi:SpoVK/Ycf46/Vps4 family AAA+-type ATPase